MNHTVCCFTEERHPLQEPAAHRAATAAQVSCSHKFFLPGFASLLAARSLLAHTSPSSRRNAPPPHRHALRDGRLPLDRQDLVRRLPAGGQRVGLRLRQGRRCRCGQPDVRPAAGRRERRVPAIRRRRRLRNLRGGLHRRLHRRKRGDARKIRRLLRGCAAQMAAQFGAQFGATLSRHSGSPTHTGGFTEHNCYPERAPPCVASSGLNQTTQSKSW